MRLVAVLCAAVAVAAVALASSRAATPPSKPGAPTRTYLRPLGAKTKTMASCRQWLYGSVAKGESIEICTWDARRTISSIRAVADAVSGRRR